MISHVQVFGFGAAMRGMRNPMDSHWKSDTIDESIGPNDLKLTLRLLKSPEERKFLRFIHVWFDLTLPRYMWAEFDTYKIGVSKNSCSTMNCLAIDRENKIARYFRKSDFYNGDVLPETLDILNLLAAQWLNNKTDRKDILVSMKNILPEGFLLNATVNINYESLLNIYFQRKDHRLETWHGFCKWIKTLPYMARFIREIEKKRV
jgi:hypothetical protein